MVRTIACICLLGVSSAPHPDPYQIFAHARQVWAAQQYPQYLTYTVAVDVTEKGVDKSKHYHLSYDALSGQIHVNPVSDEEKQAPPDPNGVTFHLIPRRDFKPLMDKKVGNPGEAVDYLGVPMISPTYSFGMTLDAGPSDASSDPLVQQIRKQFNDPIPPAKAKAMAADEKVKTISSVTSFLQRYTITLAGIDTIDGRECYHLLLKPNYDPNRLRLRELWVDEQTYQTMQLISAGNFIQSPVPWRITFDDIGGALYIASEVALAPVGVGDHRYEHASVSFESITKAPRPVHPLGQFVTKENVMSEPDTSIHK